MLKYNSKGGSINVEAFESRKDKHRFETLSNKINSADEALKICVFNFIKSDIWLHDSFDVIKDVYLNKMKFYSMFTANIQDDHEKIKELLVKKSIKYDSMLANTKSGNACPLLQALLSNKISLEYVCMVEKNKNFIDKIESDDPLLKRHINVIKKYTPFVTLFYKK